MKFKSSLFILGVFPFTSVLASDDSVGRNIIAETPDAIVCTISGANAERYIYYKRVVSESNIVRYDGPNGYLLQYDIPSGSLLTGSYWNPQPAGADCVQQQFSIGQLIKMKKAYKMLVPIPSGSVVETQ